ncbi:polysaccharide biosynthesis tyrosine autokinase [Olivibacter sp. SDN3]|uniref:GumC family protein n=1 Tax=Olivibacter sp. SDN3 TaxID=2764720 RepID=UPI001650E6B3|nr:tyrosine-protein kinase [Olivibacter sp. SDN3]QNL51639.1 polysaccharide biosynthesis tyrosine autokinase [Olivibacter sp. SDN3]
MQESNQEMKYKSNVDTGFDFREYLGRLVRLWPLFLVSLIICFAAVFLYLRYYVTPAYHVSAKVLIDDSQSSQGSGQYDLNGLLGTTSGVDNQVEILKTRFLMESLVRDLKLYVTWFNVGSFRDVELFEPPFDLEFTVNDEVNKTLALYISPTDTAKFSLKYTGDSDEEIVLDDIPFNTSFQIEGYGAFKLNKNNYSFAKGKQTYKVTIAPLDNAVGRLRGALSANISNKLTTIIDLQFDHAIRAKGEYILKYYIDEYIRQNIRDKSRIADSTIAFIDERIILVNAELDGIEQNIQRFMQDKGLANIGAQSQIILQNSNEYIKELATLETRMMVMDGVEELLSKPGGRSLISGTALNDGVADQGFNSMLNNYNSLILEKERLTLAYTADHPYIDNVNKRIESMKASIFEFIKNTRESLNVNREQLMKSAGQSQGDIRQLPAQERAFLDMSRQQQLKQELYLFLLQKREETALAKPSNISGIRVIDPPKADGSPFSPKKQIIWLGTFIFALLIPTGKIYIEDIFNTKVRGRADVEKRSSLPIIGELSHHTNTGEVVDFDSSRSPIAEQFRGLRTNLQFLMPNEQDKVVLVTSGMPGEGKSFASINLANVFAVSDKKVLLLEFDLRKPKLSKTYTGSGNGISNFIIDNQLTLADMIKPVNKAGNLYFGSCGPIPPNPSELIINPRTREMLARAREMFDIIIVDAPPIGAVTDGQLLSEYCDVSLYVVRADYTPRDLIGLPEDMRREKKMKNMAVVLNDVKEGSGSYYGYTYGYYNQEEVKDKWWKRIGK